MYLEYGYSPAATSGGLIFGTKKLTHEPAAPRERLEQLELIPKGHSLQISNLKHDLTDSINWCKKIDTKREIGHQP